MRFRASITFWVIWASIVESLMSGFLAVNVDRHGSRGPPRFQACECQCESVASASAGERPTPHAPDLVVRELRHTLESDTCEHGVRRVLLRQRMRHDGPDVRIGEREIHEAAHRLGGVTPVAELSRDLV